MKRYPLASERSELNIHPYCVDCLHFGECIGKVHFEEDEECDIFVHFDKGKRVQL